MYDRVILVYMWDLFAKNPASHTPVIYDIASSNGGAEVLKQGLISVVWIASWLSNI